MTIQDILGDKFQDEMSKEDLINAFNESSGDLFKWDENKYTTVANLRKQEDKLKAEKEARKKAEEERNASLSDSELQLKNLQDQVALLQQEKLRSDLRASYTSLGYSEKTVNELVENEFYNGEDKFVKRTELLKQANEEVLNSFKNKIIENDKAPNSGLASGTQNKTDLYRSQYREALSKNEMGQAAIIINKAHQEGISLN